MTVPYQTNLFDCKILEVSLSEHVLQMTYLGTYSKPFSSGINFNIK